jgi:hypothetical protein
MLAKCYTSILCLYLFIGLNPARAEDLLIDCTFNDGSHVEWDISNDMTGLGFGRRPYRILEDGDRIGVHNFIITNKYIRWEIFTHSEYKKILINRSTGDATIDRNNATETWRRTAGTCQNAQSQPRKF